MDVKMYDFKGDRASALREVSNLLFLMECDVHGKLLIKINQSYTTFIHFSH